MANSYRNCQDSYIAQRKCNRKSDRLRGYGYCRFVRQPINLTRYSNDLMVSRKSQAELGIEVDVVIPGQPVGLAQLAVRQRHHLREAGRRAPFL